MTDILLAVDMDNTLIHSAKKRRSGDVCVEIYNGNEQSFMSVREIELMRSLPENITLLPVTTRSIEQYKRIVWPDGLAPQRALVTNGAILLDDGIPMAGWSEGYTKLAEKYADEFAVLCDDIGNKADVLRCRMVDGMYLFACCETAEQAYTYAEQYKGRTELTVQPSGRKLYFFPSELNKGKAVKRYRDNYGCKMLICAGDSVIDYPMLEISDIAIVPDADTASRIKSERTECCADGLFAEFILEMAAQYALKCR